MKTFQKGSGDNTLVYPLTQTALGNLIPSKLASPRVGKPHGIVLPHQYSTVAGLTEMCDEVIYAHAQVRRGEMPWGFLRKHWDNSWGEFPEFPELLKREGLSIRNPQGLANIVHMDKPWHLFSAMQSWLLSTGALPKEQISPEHNDFLSKVVHPMNKFSTLLSQWMEMAFEAKYYFGKPRPEEMQGTNVSYYPEGCPTHPEVPPGHSVTSWGAVKYFQDHWHLTDEQSAALVAAGFYFSNARSFSLVHYGPANRLGRVIVGLD